ncbi:MAG TPA: hypothetical protein VFI06_07765 [Chitinophagaceae bacterium]|nr:hypothetical protein [Chitinophagaceae bacterium]
MKNLQGFLAIVSFLFITGCGKEYSFERRPPPPIDTTTAPPATPPYNFPLCSVCATLTTTELSTWSFKMDDIPVCGKADTAIVISDRTAFTFFGPSSCSGDTGMVITVYLHDTLNRNIAYTSADKVAFYYYDRVTPSYIMMSQTYAPFSGAVRDYDPQTKIATGSFEGFALRSDGRWASITLGKFKMKLL